MLHLVSAVDGEANKAVGEQKDQRIYWGRGAHSGRVHLWQGRVQRRPECAAQRRANGL